MFAYLLCATIATTLAELPNPTNKIIDSEKIVTTVEQETSAENIKEITIVEEKLITITNAIQPHMLAYKHWTGTYNPDSFTVFINDTEIAQGAQLKLSAETKTIKITFNSSFVNGMRTGTKTVFYKLNDNITHAQITFSWKDDNKILIDNGTVITS